MLRWTHLKILLLTGCLTGCDGADDDAPPTFTEVRERVLTTGCVFATCHKGSTASAAGMMSLEGDDATVHAALVDAPSSVVPELVRVVAGDPDASYVMEKLTSDMPASGERMPLDAPLEAERIELVRAWIEAGAAND